MGKKMMDKGVTIFTPTYNRAYVLSNLYKSLQRQTCSEFEWIIVDDGSTDETKKFVKEFIQENKMDITYYYQDNSGKHIAHNLGVKKAKKELFVCVDSDDYLTDTAVQQIIDLSYDAQDCIGIVCARGYTEKIPITIWKGKVKKSTLYDAYNKYGLKGDTMIVYRTNIIKTVFFPQYVGEKFVPESYLYDQLDRIGKLLITDEILYICQYLPDGYTASMKRVICNNPHGYEAYITQRVAIDKTIYRKLLDLIRYVAIKFVLKDGRIWKDVNYPFLVFIAYLPGWIFYEMQYKKYLELK